MTNSKDRITSRTNPRIKALLDIKKEPSAEAFLIEGKHLCDMALGAGCLKETFALEEMDYPNLTLVSRDVLEKVASSFTPSGLIGVAKAPSYKHKSKKALALDRVQDPGNVGTLLRTALAFGYDEVFLTKGSASPYSFKTIASSQGALFGLEIHYGVEIDAMVKELKARGYSLYASALRNAKPLKEIAHPEGPFALIVGNEGQGISSSLLELSDTVVKIEMEGIESLNVGVAGGILMYQL